MVKHVISEIELKMICLNALKRADLSVENVEVVGTGRKGARGNWEVRALSPVPDMPTAEAAFDIIKGLQEAFDLTSDALCEVSALGYR